MSFDQNPKQNFLNVVIGNHDGETLEAIAEHWPQYHWVIVEKTEQLDQVKVKLDAADLPNTQVCNIDELGAFIEHAHPTVLFNHTWVLLAPTGMDEEYQQLHWQAETIIRSRATNFIAQHSIKKHVEIGLQNLAENNLPAIKLTHHLNNKDVVICAGGPSLDEQIPWLIANRDRLIVIAISRVAAHLSNNGVTPHFIVLCDPFDYNFDVSAAMLEIDTPSVLLYAWHACQLLVGNWTGPKAYMGRIMPDVDETNVIATSPTVTNAALNFVLTGNPRQIIFAGTDLCLAPDAQSHCGGNLETSLPSPIKSDDLKVSTMSGRLAFARPYMVLAAEALSRQIKQFNCSAKIYNLNPDAVEIQGIEHIDKDNVLFGTDTFDVNEVITEINDTKKLSLKDRTVALKQFEYRIGAIKKLAGEAIRKGKNIPTDPVARKKRLMRISNNADKIASFDKTRTLLTRSFGSEFTAALRQGTDQSEMSLDEQLERTLKIHRGYYNACKTMESYCEAAHERIQLKQSELDGTIDSDAVDRWIEIGIARRATLLNDKTLNDKGMQAFEEFKASAREHRLSVFQSHLHTTPAALMAQTRQAFADHDVDRLLVFLKYSQEQFTGEVKEQFAHWTQAMICELCGDLDQAMLNYVSVVEVSQNGLAESALLNLLQLTLRCGRHEDAINTACVLVEINDQHQGLLEKTETLVARAA